jgi:putative two-component system response regulator
VCAAEAHCDAAEPGDGAVVLIVDDERGPRESLRMILASHHRVLATEGASDALTILRSEPVDLVTVDLNMPGMKGDELMRTIRAEFPHVDVIVITGCGSLETAIEGIRFGVADYLTKPFDVVQVTGAVTRTLDRRQSRMRLISFLEGIGEILGRDRDADDILTELDDSHALRDRLRDMLSEPVLEPARSGRRSAGTRTVEFLEVLAETIENRDVFLRGHARRVAFFAGLLADALALTDDAREELRIAAFLHDIGKVGVPTDLLTAQTAIEAGRRAAIEQHAAVGERLVQPLGFAGSIASTIRHHHERWDGNGYPDRLRGAEIPLAPRMIAVVDAFDAMTSERPDRPALTAEEAVAELRKHAGSQFDPQLATTFAGLVEGGACELAVERAGDEEST